MDRTTASSSSLAGSPAATAPPRGRRWNDDVWPESPDAPCETFFEALSRMFSFAIVRTDGEGRIVSVDDALELRFPGSFRKGRDFLEALDAVTQPVESIEEVFPLARGEAATAHLLRGGELRCEIGREGPAHPLAHLALPAGEGLRAQVIVDLRREKSLLDAHRGDLRQLGRMREIIDLLYESMSVSGLIDLILVAVTAGRGFGFNRAFYLEAKDGRLIGRRGIGPASVEEARGIWGKLEEADPSLRETLDLLSRSEGTPDPATQELVRSIDLDLESETGAASGLAVACRDRCPVLLCSAGLASGSLDARLFETLLGDSAAVVPLIVGEDLAGVLVADNFITGHAIGSEDLTLLRTFSRYAGIALERSRLHDELTRNNQQLRAANRELQTHQRKLLQAEKLSALGKMAACVSHEIRNPLVAIGGLARSIHDGEALAGESHEALRLIVNEVERLERFLRETLNFVKPQSGPFPPFDLCEVVRSVAEMFREDIVSRGIRLEVRVPAEPVPATLDADLLRGALSNLIKNAADATPEGGEIAVDFSVDGGLATLEVADTGPGIASELRDLVFEPFFTKKDDGTGIGLAITQQNVSGLRGSISLESHESYATLFRIKIPL